MNSHLKHFFCALAALVPLADATAQTASASCGSASPACVASCARFAKSDARSAACEDVCRRESSEAAQCNREPVASPVVDASRPEVRAYSKKGDALRERELNGRMIKAIQQSDLQEIRRLIEMRQGLNPTYVYDFDFNPQTRQYEGRAVKLRLTDILKDSNTIRPDDEGLDKILALLIELGLDVRSTLSAPTVSTSSVGPSARTAWGPSLTFMEKAKDRAARIRAFEIALENGLKPNQDVSEWLFTELPQVCGRDRSQFAIQMVDLLIKHLGTSLQDDFWRTSERGPETLAEVLDRLMSPGSIPTSNYERNQFAMMDQTWENCALLSRRLNRYLTEGT
jgi:hypothetical protein